MSDAVAVTSAGDGLRPVGTRLEPIAAPLYAEPRTVTDLSECVFYHSMDIPGYGSVAGQFDLRGHEQTYLGNVDFKGKRVLEVGTASGFLCFHMERQGAEVVSVDLSEEHSWDVVPFAGLDGPTLMGELRQGVRRMNNAYWLGHRAFGSKARVVYGSVYDIPAEVGPVDITTFCATLVHFRDPIGALQSALRLTKDTVIVTEVLGNRSFFSAFLDRVRRPRMIFLPDYRKCSTWDGPARLQHLDQCLTWWGLSPRLITEWLHLFGFRDTRVTFHKQLYMGKRLPSFTVVGRR